LSSPAPDLDRASTRVPDLTGAQSLRFCQDPRDWVAGSPPTAAELSSSLGPEALVRGLDELARDVADIPDAHPARCAAISYVQTRDSLVIRYPDRVVIVPVTGCTDLHLDGRIADGASLRYAFMDALDRQRDRYAYTHRVDAHLTCRTFRAHGPIKPGQSNSCRRSAATQ
jgi:hypothetical protein